MHILIYFIRRNTYVRNGKQKRTFKENTKMQTRFLTLRSQLKIEHIGLYLLPKIMKCDRSVIKIHIFLKSSPIHKSNCVSGSTWMTILIYE